MEEWQNMLREEYARRGVKKMLEEGAKRELEFAQERARQQIAKRGGATAARRLAGQAVTYLRQIGSKMGGSAARLATVAGQALARVGTAIVGVVTSEAFVTAVAVCVAIIAVALVIGFLWSAISQHNQQVQRQQHEDLDRSTEKLLHGFNDQMKNQCLCHGGPRKATAFVGTAGPIASVNVPMGGFCAWPNCVASGAA